MAERIRNHAVGARLRGGSFRSDAHDVRCAFRFRGPLPIWLEWYVDFGFRVVSPGFEPLRRPVRFLEFSGSLDRRNRGT